MWSSNLDRGSGTKSSGSEGQCRCRSREMTVTSGHLSSSSSSSSCCLSATRPPLAVLESVSGCIRGMHWDELEYIGMHWYALERLGALMSLLVHLSQIEQLFPGASWRCILSSSFVSKLWSSFASEHLFALRKDTRLDVQQWVAEKQSDKPVLTSSKSSNTSSSSPSCTLYTHDPEKATPASFSLCNDPTYPTRHICKLLQNKQRHDQVSNYPRDPNASHDAIVVACWPLIVS